MDKEFDFSDQHFEQLRDLVMQHSGIMLSEGKQELVYGRLARRLRKLGLSGFDAYLELLNSEQRDTELTEFVNAITTNLTAFFRESHHFDALAQQILPKILLHNAHNRRLRIWSAGCSTGEEPYSIAITLRETMPDIEQWDVRILATDIDSNVLARAEQGIYDQERVEGMSEERLKRWFKRGRGPNHGMVRVNAAIRQLIAFKQLNLMQPFPMKGPFDIIFCRNVVIYFNKETQRILFDRYANILVPGGHLFIGHSENLFKVCDRFDGLGQTVYQRRS